MKKETVREENIKADIKDHFSALKSSRVGSLADSAVGYGILFVIFTGLAIAYRQPLGIAAAIISCILFGAVLTSVIYSVIKTKKECKIALEDHTVTGDKLISVRDCVLSSRHRRRMLFPNGDYYTFHKLNFHTGEWSVPLKCYKWSKEMQLSETGLTNVSIEGEEFYVVSGRDGTIYYVYPKNIFSYEKETELKASD